MRMNVVRNHVDEEDVRLTKEIKWTRREPPWSTDQGIPDCEDLIGGCNWILWSGDDGKTDIWLVGDDVFSWCEALVYDGVAVYYGGEEDCKKNAAIAPELHSLLTTGKTRAQIRAERFDGKPSKMSDASEEDTINPFDLFRSPHLRSIQDANI